MEFLYFFPDPWPKKKHYKRRIIDESFINLISKKFIRAGLQKLLPTGQTIVTIYWKYLKKIIILKELII